MDYLIIGGGASGMVSAINLSKKGYKVTIIEKNNSLGKKLLRTGSGRCNYFNDDFNETKYYSEEKNEITRFINEENKNKVLEFFDSLGVVPKIKEGYYYPYSNSASSILNTFMVMLKNLGVRVILDENVIDIKKSDKFIVTTSKNVYQASKVVLATGSKAGLKEDSDIFKILESFDLKVYKMLPGLVPLIGSDNYYKEWENIRCRAVVSLYENDKFIDKETGEIQLNNYGISGICVLNLSNYISRSISKGNKVSVYINFIPYVDKSEALKYLKYRASKNEDFTVLESLESIIPYKLLYCLFKVSKINPDKKWLELTNKEQEVLASNLCNLKFNVYDTKELSMAQVAIGGVSLEEVKDNFEVKRIPGLYITGELLDCTGKCGGYNLGLSWISGLGVK